MVKSPPENTQRLMPRLAYQDAPAAIDFLCRAFGFEETGRFAPGGKVVYSEIALGGEILFAVGSSYEGARSPRELGGVSIELFCYVEDVDSHYSRAKAAGTTILSPPEDKFWGIARMPLWTARAFAGRSARSSRTCPFLTRSPRNEDPA